MTTPQKLAFVDVAKGIRMFARMAVPCAAVAENMSYFDGADGVRYRPFGAGSGARIVRDFGLPNLVQFPIVPELSAAGDGARALMPAARAATAAVLDGSCGSHGAWGSARGPARRSGMAPRVYWSLLVPPLLTTDLLITSAAAPSSLCMISAGYLHDYLHDYLPFQFSLTLG